MGRSHLNKELTTRDLLAREEELKAKAKKHQVASVGWSVATVGTAVLFWPLALLALPVAVGEANGAHKLKKKVKRVKKELKKREEDGSYVPTSITNGQVSAVNTHNNSDVFPTITSQQTSYVIENGANNPRVDHPFLPTYPTTASFASSAVNTSSNIPYAYSAAAPPKYSDANNYPSDNHPVISYSNGDQGNTYDTTATYSHLQSTYNYNASQVLARDMGSSSISTQTRTQKEAEL